MAKDHPLGEATRGSRLQWSKEVAGSEIRWGGRNVSADGRPVRNR